MADDVNTADSTNGDAPDGDTHVPADREQKKGPVGPTILGHDPTGMRSQLSRPSDVATRPGFRAPTNKRSKSQAKRSKKGGKKR
jgi:hypothetical protein